MITHSATIRPTQHRHSERGLSLAEALVAITIFAVVFISALTLYSVASSAYLRTDSAVIQQQNVRFTMDRISETLRDAGAGHNMLGARNLADEQIEGIWESAVFVRGDFNDDRETALESTTFPIVTTGNDEIVGYVLRKDPDSNGTVNNTIPITIKADLTPAGGRDAIFTSNASIAGEETATIMVAATDLAGQTKPPYQLTKVTFDNGGLPQYEIIAENINQLRFTYATASSASPLTASTVLASTVYGSADSHRVDRATIRKIGVRLVGMSDRPDLNYRNTSTGPTAGFRTFPIEQTILATNLGIVGGPHNATPPLSLPIPASITDCTGHCRQHLIQWAAAAGVSTYQLRIEAAAFGSLAAYVDEFPVTALQYEFQDPDEDIAADLFRPYQFSVAATSGSTVGTFTPAVTLQSFNDTASIPSKPMNVAAVGSATENAMSVSWDAVTTNTGPVTATTLCASSPSSSSAPPSPWNGLAKDLTDSKVFRARSTGLNTGTSATVDVSNEVLGTIQNAVSNTAFLDRTAAPCSPYFYRVKACDLCTITSVPSDAMTTPVSFQAAAGVTPAKPPAAPTVVGSVGSNGTDYILQLQWSPVILDSAGKPAAVAHYILERWSKVGAAAYTKQTEFDIYETTLGPLDTIPINDASSNNIDYRYYVRAIYDCSTIRVGPLSDPYDLACTPPVGNTMDIAQPVNADVITRPSETLVPLSLVVAGPNWTGASIQVQNAAGTVVYSANLSGTPASGTTYTFPSWNVSATSIPDGYYTVTATAVVNGLCRAQAGPRTFQIETVACGQRIVNAVFRGNGVNTGTSMEFKIENSCPNTVTINQLTSIWQGVKSTVRIGGLSSGSTPFCSNCPGVASNQAMTLTPNITLATGTVQAPSLSALFTFSFNASFTSDGTKNGTPGAFSSIIARITSPTSTNEQLVDGATTIP
ncbi:MAG: hypothetical protein ABI779_02795 [Acidobacteriota bacterium]